MSTLPPGWLVSISFSPVSPAHSKFLRISMKLHLKMSNGTNCLSELKLQQSNPSVMSRGALAAYRALSCSVQ